MSPPNWRCPGARQKHGVLCVPTRSTPLGEKTPDNLERKKGREKKKNQAQQKEIKGSPEEKEHARPGRHPVTDFMVFIPLSRGLSHGPRRWGSARGGREAAPPAPRRSPPRPALT